MRAPFPAHTYLHTTPPPTHPLGTGCIFHYDEDFPEGSGKGFKESDTPNFTGSYYSYTKVCARVAGEGVLQAARAPPLLACRCLLLLAAKPSLDADPPSPQAATEGFLKEFPNVLTLRVRMPIVEDLVYPRNFITKARGGGGGG